MEQREVAGITIQLIIELVRREKGEEGLRALLELADETRPLELLENTRIWHSFSTRRRLFEAGIKVTGDPEFPTRVGASILSSRRSATLLGLLSRFGSPGGILRALPVAHSKFDTACESHLVAQKPGYALVDFRTKEGYEPSPYDCRYAMGLYSQITPLFGMPSATVVQLQCQAEGADHCIFQIGWPPGRQPRRPRRNGPDLVQIQLEDLQQAVAELLRAKDVGEILSTVIEHAGAAVAAQQLLVAVRMGEGEPPVISAEGFRPASALKLGAALLDTGVLAGEPIIAGTHFLVSDIASKQQNFGKLVAFSSAPFIEGEQQLLDSYSRLASSALETGRAVQVAEARQLTAEVLASFAARLITVQDTVEIGQAAVEAAQQLVSSDRAVAFRHNEENDSLEAVARLGYEEGLGAAVDSLVITEDDTAELTKIISSPDSPRVYDRESADDYLRKMMEVFEVDLFAAIPIRSSRRVLGALAVSWTSEHRPVDADLVARQLAGIADQAAGAWEKATLLEQIHEQASIDALTGLANRRVFAEALGSLLGHEENPPLAVVFCDVDRFKSVNDVLGHAAGDELLVAVGQRLRRCVRSDDLVARLGGDEFTVLMTDVGDAWRPEGFAAKIQEEMREPIEIDGSQFLAHLSLGAVEAVPGQTTVKDVLRRADAAMYVAKSQGGDRLVAFSEEMLTKRSERLELEAALADAVSSADQFVVLYEPQLDISSGEIVGAEALVRWQHPQLGLLPPDRFLPVAEETGLITPIDLQVLRTGLEALARWKKAGLGLHLSVNFSARTLTSPGLVTLVSRELDRTGAPAERLEVELTESTAIVDPEALSEILLALRGLRVSVAIDDVGTGYSSLALLHKLPAQKLKIDRSFVQRIDEDDASRSVVEAVLLLADRLGQQVVAEGVETAEQLQELRALGCQLAQGYLFARPGSEERLISLLEKRER